VAIQASQDGITPLLNVTNPLSMGIGLKEFQIAFKFRDPLIGVLLNFSLLSPFLLET